MGTTMNKELIQLTDKDNMKLLVQDSINKKELLFLSF